MDSFSKIAILLSFQNQVPSSRAWKAFAVEFSEVVFPRQMKGERSLDVCWKGDWQPFNWELTLYMAAQHKQEQQLICTHVQPWRCTLHISAKVRCGPPKSAADWMLLPLHQCRHAEQTWPFFHPGNPSYYLISLTYWQTTMMNYSQHQNICREIKDDLFSPICRPDEGQLLGKVLAPALVGAC